jgi:hypothetical protein
MTHMFWCRRQLLQSGLWGPEHQSLLRGQLEVCDREVLDDNVVWAGLDGHAQLLQVVA